MVRAIVEVQFAVLEVYSVSLRGGNRVTLSWRKEPIRQWIQHGWGIGY
jgi:hypothetical protein